MAGSPAHRTKIICTLGPATDTPGMVERLLSAGCDVARLNGAHGSIADLDRRLSETRRVARRLGLPLAFLLDLPGPKLRLSVLRQSALELRRRDELYLGRGSAEDTLPVSDASFLADLRAGDPVYLADGTVRLIVLRAGSERVRVRVDIGGVVRSRSGINLPQSQLSLGIPTRTDRQLMRWAGQAGVDWLGVSFVRSVDDLRRVRAAAAATACRARLVAKIEKAQALRHLEAIVGAADAVMVARGDLGVETPIGEMPLAQKRIIREARRQARPVITATQMLESMVDNASPTRAEITDIANAVLDGTDAVMLSAETAVGHHPEAAVRVLADVLAATEADYPYADMLERVLSPTAASTPEAVARSTCQLALDMDVSAIVVAAPAADLALRIARFRPSAPIVVIGPDASGDAGLLLVWNVRCLPWSDRKSKQGLSAGLARLGVPVRGRRVLHVSAIADSTARIEVLTFK